jgi:biofilm PGA synthesis protein PgaD
MDKSGQRVAIPKVIIKNRLRSKLRQIIEGIISLVCWSLLIYVLLPIFTLILWLFGIQTVYQQVIGEQGYKALLSLLKDGGVIVFVTLTIIINWTYYNYALFKIRGDRRSKCGNISNAGDIACLLDTDVETLEKIKTSCRLEVDLANNQYVINCK